MSIFNKIYKKFVIDFPKITLLIILSFLIFCLYHSKDFNLDASSDALILEGDEDLKYSEKLAKDIKLKIF